MEITKSTAKDYQKEIRRLKNQLVKPSIEEMEEQLNVLAVNVRDQSLRDCLSSIPKNVLTELANQEEGSKSKPPFYQLGLGFKGNGKSDVLEQDSVEKLFEVLKDQSFPLFNHPETTLETSLFTYLRTYAEVQEGIVNLQLDYLGLLDSLNQATETVISHDRNAFFRLFQRRSKKEEVREAKEELLEDYSKLEVLETDLNSLKLKSIHPAQGVSHLDDLQASEVNYLAKNLKLDSEALDPLYARLKDLSEGVLAQIDRVSLSKINEEIRDLWKQLADAQIQRELEIIPLDALRAKTPADFPWDDFYLAGYDTVAKLNAASFQSLNNQFGCSIEGYDFLHRNIEAFIQDRHQRYTPKLNIDNLRAEEYQLLDKVNQRRQIPNNTRKIIQKMQTDIDSFKDLSTFVEDNYQNNIQLVQATDQDRLDILNHLKMWVRQLSEIMKAFEDVDLNPPQSWTQKQLKQDFAKNSATYYAILEEVIGVGQTYQPKDVPDYIVDEVNAFDIILDDLEVTLRRYQLFGAKYALHYKRTLLGDEMGLGKTIQAIAVINHLYQSGRKHAMVVCPLSVLTNWKREIDKWSHIPSYAYRGDQRQSALNNWISEGGVLLLNYEQVFHLLDQEGFTKLDCLIVDEAHYVKNPRAKRTQAVNELGKMAEYVQFLTGTPIENKVREMQHLISMLDKDLAKRMTRQMADEKPKEFKQLSALVYLRRKRADVLGELPEKEEIELWSTFSPIEQNFYNEAVRMGLRGLMKMRRAGFAGLNPKDSEKLQQIIDICEESKENGHKVLIFSFFNLVLDVIEPYLDDVVIGRVRGGVTSKDRQKMIDQFTEAEPGAVLLSQIDAGGVGLNIQAANVVILCEPQWKPSTENQAIGRVYRMGQTRNVIVYRLLTQESIDESIRELLGYKTEIFNQFANDSLVSDAYDRRQNIEEISEKELQKQVFKMEEDRLARRMEEEVAMAD